MKLVIGLTWKTVAINSSTLLWLLVYIKLLALPYILYAQTMIVCGDFVYSSKYWIKQFEVLPCLTRSMSVGVCRHPCGALVYIFIYDHSLYFVGGFGQECFFVSALMCDSRNWNPWLNSFVREPPSGGDFNAPCPAVSVPHLDVNAGRRGARQARSALLFCMLGGIRPSYSWTLPYVELERINKGHRFQISASFPKWHIISSGRCFFHGRLEALSLS